jgi:DNA-binding GntR family transcriptional regulator
LIKKSNREHHLIVEAIFAMTEPTATSAMREHLGALQASIASMIAEIAAGPTPGNGNNRRRVP